MTIDHLSSRRTPRSMARLLGLSFGLALSAILVGSFLGPSPVHAVDQTKGHAGFCKNDQGVTVVVDFGKLGGQPIVRCNPRTTRGTGLDALKGAGFQIAGVQRWGESFICRIENRPSAVEKLPIQGSSGYLEKCVDTPPAAGYWSYWHAGNNCAWKYSQWGVKNRDFVPGGFEGWSFSLNTTADSSPAPRIGAVRPGSEGGTCNAPDQAAPRSNDPDEKATSRPDPSVAEPSQSSADGALPAPKPRNMSADEKVDEPTEKVTFSGGEDAADVNDTIREQSGASQLAPWVATAVVVLLGVTMWLTSRRRRRAHEG